MGDTTGWATATVLTTCVLCGDTGPDVRHGLIHWRDGAPYGFGPRCRDHGACWDRCLAQGEEWPVADGRPRGVARHVKADRPVASPRGAEEPPSEAGVSQAPVEELDFGTGPEAVPA